MRRLREPLQEAGVKVFDDVASFSCFNRNISRIYYLIGALVCCKHFSVGRKYFLYDSRTLTMAKKHHKVKPCFHAVMVT